MKPPILKASIGKEHPAKVHKTWSGTFPQFVKALLTKVPITDDKASAGWVCGAVFNPEYRDSENFAARHFLSLDYDHITNEDLAHIRKSVEGCSHLGYTTFSHDPERPRYRLWIPLSRPCQYDEFQAVSRRFAASAGIELAARESHVPAQFMYRPTQKAGVPFEHFEDINSPPLDVDKVLGEYSDWKDRTAWPHRAEADGVHNQGSGESPLDKPGVIGDFCRSFRIQHAIERFGLPYRPGSTEGRWTYTGGSREDGAVIYDDDTKLHSHHDTDPAHGQHNAFDLVRLHHFGGHDNFDDPSTPIERRTSYLAMAEFAAGLPELSGFEDLDAADAAAEAADTSWMDAQGSVAEGAAKEDAGEGDLPEDIVRASNKCTDQENARRIQRRYKHQIISVAGAFYFWTGTHWTPDETSVFKKVATLSAIVAAEAAALLKKANGDEKATKFAEQRRAWAAQCGQKSTQDACLTILRRLLDFPAEKLNAKRHLLTCLSGTIDLRDGSHRPPESADFITACAPVHYRPGTASAPRFERFLQEIFVGNEEVIAFAKRWFGYCTTGENREHALVFHIGHGGNGKSKLIEAVQNVLGGGYATTGARGTLKLKSAGASPEIMWLLGKRMVTLNETNNEEEFDEGLLKDLTGSETLTARNLYKGLTEFRTTHKLQIFTNSEPRIHGTDRGLWRRIFKLDYPVRYGRDYEIECGIATQLQDDTLPEQLAAESEGIFAWLVEGAREWYQKRLSPPPSVVRSTEEMKASQDQVGEFLKERTVRDPNGRVSFLDLYGSYAGWSKRRGFGQLSYRRAVKYVRENVPYASAEDWMVKGTHVKGFKGLRLAEEEFPQEG